MTISPNLTASVLSVCDFAGRRLAVACQNIVRRGHLKCGSIGRPPGAARHQIDLVINLKIAKALGLTIQRCWRPPMR